MAEADETYFRKYLSDPAPDDPVNVIQEVDNTLTTVETSDTVYFRKYLNDPNA
jgi:hypothetical protein